ncbi:MAG: arylsulfatase [Candidatus Brocadiaceae bacterium]
MQANEQNRPNIVLILVDDMGFSDIGCYGSEIRTPNLDRLAESGVRFSHAYNGARCCPTRASLLTGLYAQQAGVGHMVGDRGVGPAYQGFLRDDCVTIAEALKPAGYRTCMSGKWHVGGVYAPDDPESWRPGDARHPIPVQRGFDCHYGMLGGAGNYFNPPGMVQDDTVISPGGGDYYITDAISGKAVEMIEDAAADDSPFFLYVSYTAPHWPLQALPEDIARYEGTYGDGGWDAVRTRRHEELNASGILDPCWGISPRDGKAPPWEKAEHREWEDLRMAVYAAQIDRMDQGVGRIMGRLRELGMAENTLVMFLSDNGGCAEFLREDEGDGWPGCYARTLPDGRRVQVGNVPGRRPGPADTFMSYDLPWAHASNSPFRLYKHWVHEGGIATPLILHWPAGVGTGARIEHTPVHIIDVMPTVLEAAGAQYPAEHAGNPVQPMEGQSVLPLVQGRSFHRGVPIFWEHEGNRAVRRGRWKLVSRYPGPWELYDMVEDRTELNDLADGNRGVVRELGELYDRWAERCGVIPWEELTG